MAATQRCLYEILGVERAASIEEIRSAYRKLALKLHPDKIQQSGASPSACQEATLQFQEIGRAYEVLSDPSERSWYDSHRSQILSSSSSPSSDFDFNPWPYFSASVYSGYGDTGNGFYAVYGDLFTKLHQQEKDFAGSHGLPPPFDPPDMGGLSTDYAQVQKFYSYWSGFSTVKDFSWCDEFRASDGPNRKLRRLMEEENKKIRSKARKEYNEAIRRLVAFVKKRDKRVLERQVELQRLAQEKEELRKARLKKSEEEKKLKARLFKEAEWTKVASTEDDLQYGSDYDDSVGSYSWAPSTTNRSTAKKERQDEFYCVICNKKFKSDEQWRNHERSKKHLEKSAILKESFEQEDKEFEALKNERVVSEDFSECRGSPVTLSEAETPLNADLHEANKQASSSDHGNASDETDSETGNGEDDSLLNMANSYAGRQQQSRDEDSDNSNKAHEGDEEEEMLAALLKSQQSQQQLEENENEDEHASSSTFVVNKEVEELMQDAGGKSKKRRSKARIRTERQQAAGLNRHVRLMEELSLVESSQQCETFVGACSYDQVTEDDSATLETEEFHLGKAEKNVSVSRENRASKLKTRNGHTMPETEQPRKPSRCKKNKGIAKSAENTCETCGEDFESRNKLFKHISLTKHAALRGK